MIEIAFPNGKKMLPKCRVLAGDVGGTNARLTLFDVEGESFKSIREHVYASKNYGSIEEIVKEFLRGESSVDVISLGVAGPVLNEAVKVTNLPYTISVKQIKEETGIPHAYIINDLEASAFGLAALSDEDLLVLHEGRRELLGNAALISPGTGLGEAGLFWDGSHYHPFATEGGHCDYAPETEEDIGLLRYLQKVHGHVSWERVVSGMGIYDIYKFLNQNRSSETPEWLVEKFTALGPGAAISYGATHEDSVCIDTMQMFLRNLANEAANVVMKLNGFGGLFIGGGILPKNLQFLHQKDFIYYFLEAGRMGPLLQEVTVQVILNDKAAVMGAAYYGAYSARPALQRK